MKTICKYLLPALAVLLAAAGLTVCALCLRSRVRQTAAARLDLPIYCVQKQDRVCSLTFDAAWGNEDTQTLIDILAERTAFANLGS